MARFSTADAAGPGVAPVAGLPSRPEPDDTGAPIGPEDYRAVVGTALFGPAADAALAFRHQQYAEFLAASYLVNRDIGRPSLRALLSAAEDNLLPGTMAGVTSWLMALNRELTAELVASNALQLARTGLELPDDNARAVLTEALLDRAAAGDIDPEWGLDLEPLANARLAGQLRQSIAEGIHCPEHLWWVASLATAGSCADLAGELLGPTMDPRWMPWARGAGVQAIRILGDRELRARLRSLLSLDDQEDPDDELLADAIEALYPELLQTAEMLASLRPRRNDHLIGGYVMLLRRLPAMVPDQDLPTALLWLAERVGATTRDAYGQLPEELIRRGWHASSTDAVLHALAAVLAQVARTDARFDFRHAAHPWDGVEPNDRRRLAVAVAAELNAESGWWSLFKLGLINGDDAMWLVDELPNTPENARPALAACLPQVVGEPTLELADRIYNLDPTHPAYEATQWLRTPVSLDSETARRWQRIHAEDRAEADATLDPVRQQGLLLDALGEAERDPAEWWKVLYWLSVENGHTGRRRRCCRSSTFVHMYSTSVARKAVAITLPLMRSR